MGASVATLFVPGGKPDLKRDELNKLCEILGIPDQIKQGLPVGEKCTYYLLLSTQSKLPKTCAPDVPPGNDERLLKLVVGGKPIV
jgi:hypothetical protein